MADRKEYSRKWRQEHQEQQKELVREWNKRNPEKRNIYHNRFFEKKAQERFGADYIPPENEQELSEQAKIVKNEYHQLKNREHRAKKKAENKPSKKLGRPKKEKTEASKKPTDRSDNMNNVIIQYNQMEYLFDQRLSLKAKGLMAIMVAYINKNQPSVFLLDDVMDFCCDGRVAFKNALTELEQYGYLEKSRGKAGFVKGSSPWTFILRE